MTYGEVVRIRIIELCKKRNLSYNGLAIMSGVPQSTINEIMHFRSHNPSLKTINELARAFCMTASEFLDFPEMNEYEIE